MKVLVALLLLVASSAVAAQTMPVCWPKEARGGTGSPAIVKMDGNCIVFGWTCGNLNYKMGGSLTSFPTEYVTRAVELLTGNDTERRNAVTQYSTSPQIPALCKPLTDRLEVALNEQWAASQPAPAPTINYVVAPAASNASPAGTRPAFPFSNGVRGTVSNGRAISGTACDCSVKSGEYCGVNGRTDQVALCVAAP